MSRLLFLCLLATSIGCSGPSDEPARGASSPPPASDLVPEVTCEAREPSRCRSIEQSTLDELPTDGVLVWAQAAVGAVIEDERGRAIGVTKIAIYEDGTIRRTPVLRGPRFLATPPRGLVVARLDPGSLTRVRDAVAAVRAEDMRAFERSDGELRPDDTDLFLFPSGMACMPKLRSDPSCGADSLASVRVIVAKALEATEKKWRDARAGTVSLGRPLAVSGRWPLDEALAKDGFLDAGEAERRLVAGGELYRLAAGDWVRVEASTRTDGETYVYVARVSPVVLSDAALVDRLLANAGRYVASRGEWLGIPLEGDRFVEMKNREIAIVPATEGEPERAYELYAVEQLDLTDDGPIALPHVHAKRISATLVTDNALDRMTVLPEVVYRPCSCRPYAVR